MHGATIKTVGCILLFYLMMEADLMTDTLFMAYVPQTVDIVQQNICVMRQPWHRPSENQVERVSIIHVRQERTGEECYIVCEYRGQVEIVIRKW